MDPLNEEKQQLLTYLYDVLFVDLYNAYDRMLETETFYFFVQQYIDILIFCIHVHHTRIRYYLIKNEIIQHILKGLGLKQKIIILMISKFFKALIQSKDEFLLRYLESKHLLKPLLDLFAGPSKKSQMFQSIMLDIISMIYTEDHDGLKRECEIFPFMSTQIVKNIIKNAQTIKEKRFNMKESRITPEFFNEKPSTQNRQENVLFARKGVLNLNLLDEDDSEMILSKANEFDHSINFEGNNDKTKVFMVNENNNLNILNQEDNGKNEEEYEIGNGINMVKDKRPHSENEEFSQIEQDITKNKKIKIE